MALTKVSGDVIQSTINIGVATVTSINVGSAVTIDASGINATGVITASSFSGPLTGNVTGNATGLSGTPNINVTNITSSSGTVLIGSASNTGTSNQKLQVTGGAYISGSLGIGATSPGRNLDVITGSNTGILVRQVVNINSGWSVNDYTEIGLGAFATNAGIRAIQRDTPVSSQAADLAFFTTTNANAYAERARITANGSVGIGTTNPSTKLHVVGGETILKPSTTSEVPLRIQRSASTGRAQFTLEDESGTQIWRVGSTGAGSTSFSFFDTPGNRNVITLDKSNNSVYVDSTYSVGIGTTNPDPTQTMTVYGSGALATIKFSSATSGNLYVGSVANQARIQNEANTPLVFYTNNTERVRITSAGNLGIGLTNPQFQLQTTGNALFNGQYLVDRYLGMFNDPGSYPEYMLIGRVNSSDVFRVIGSIYGVRGGSGERNVFFNICASKTSFPSSSYAAGNKLGTAGFSLVTLTYSGNSWLALSSSGPTITGALNLYFTGQIYHSYSSTQWVHQDFFGSTGSIPTGSVSGVSAAIVTF